MDRVSGRKARPRFHGVSDMSGEGGSGMNFPVSASQKRSQDPAPAGAVFHIASHGFVGENATALQFPCARITSRRESRFQTDRPPETVRTASHFPSGETDN